jgi:hypothetical protein
MNLPCNVKFDTRGIYLLRANSCEARIVPCKKKCKNVVCCIKSECPEPPKKKERIAYLYPDTIRVNPVPCPPPEEPFHIFNKIICRGCGPNTEGGSTLR